MGVVKTWNGIARASLKTWDGIAAASVKTINGFDATAGATLQDRFETDASGLAAVGSASTRVYCANYFTAGSYGGAAGYTANALEFYIRKFGSPSFNYSFCLWTHNINAPGTLLAESGTLAASALSTSNAWINLGFTGVALTNGTRYWFGIHTDGYGDTNNLIRWETSSNGPSYEGWTLCKISSDGSSWNNLQNANNMMRVYS